MSITALPPCNHKHRVRFSLPTNGTEAYLQCPSSSRYDVQPIAARPHHPFQLDLSVDHNAGGIVINLSSDDDIETDSSQPINLSRKRLLRDAIVSNRV